MAVEKFLVDINLNKNQILNAALQSLAVHPSSPALGQIYFNTVDETVYCWDGTGWLDLGYLNGSYTPQNINATGANIIAQLQTDASGNVISAATRVLTLQELGLYDITLGDISLAPNQFITGISLDNGRIVGFSSTIRNYADAVHTHTTSQITDLTATAAEINKAADISMVTGAVAGWTYKMTSSTTAEWARIKGSEIENDVNWVVINDAASSGGTTYSSNKINDLIDTLAQNMNSLIAGSLVFQSTFTPTTASDTPAPTTGSIKKGFTWVVNGVNDFTWNGSIAKISNGDMIIALVDNAVSSNPAHWSVVNKNIEEIVNASLTARGIIQLASNADVNTGTDDQKAITPAGLNQRKGTESIDGLVQLATQTEVNTGTNNTKAITPQKLKAFYDANVAGYTTLFGNGVLTQFDIVHNLASYCNVMIIDAVSGVRVHVEVSIIDLNTVRLKMNNAPTSNQYRVIITK